jgi:hypothetical protein
MQVADPKVKAEEEEDVRRVCQESIEVGPTACETVGYAFLK